MKNQKAIAFLIPNRKPQRSLDSFVVTIDKLEEVTGLDFLDKVPDALESKMEASSDIEQWKLKTTISKPQKHQSKETKGQGSYWISSSSDTRHNSTCRWFKKSKGKYGSATTGTSCKSCGG